MAVKSNKEYMTWIDMKRRCYNVNRRQYRYYGGRGIKVCERWLESFENFLEDMGKRPSDRHSLDRIDVNGDYCKENCRWSTIDEQNRNKTTSRKLTYNGKTQTHAEWERELQLSSSLIQKRIDMGWVGDKLFSPARKKSKKEKK